MRLNLVILLEARMVSASSSHSADKSWRVCARILLVGLNMRLMTDLVKYRWLSSRAAMQLI